jgi:MYXO-CTERM domain-containing protein
MKRTTLLLAFLLTVTASADAWAAPTTGSLKAGRDARGLSTLDGVPLAGYGGATRRKTFPANDGYSFFLKKAEGVRDTVRVKTLVLEVDGMRMAFISVDAIGAARSIVDAVVAELGNTGLTRETIMMVGTHTHSSVGALSDKIFWQVGAVDRFNTTVLNHVVDNIVDSLEASIASLEPAKLGNGSSEVLGITKNRRTDNAPVNTDLGILKVETMSGDPLAVLFNFAIHGTSMPSDLMISADNMGYAERYLEAQIPGAVALFANGAEGDVAPESGGLGGVAGAQSVGETLGTAVKNLWDATGTDSETTLEIQTVNTDLPDFDINVTACGDEFLALFSQWNQILPGEAAETSEIFMAIRVNDDAFLGVPGEAITEVGRAIQDPILARGFENAYIMGLANGYMGYVVSPEEYDLGGYEACGTLYGRNTADTVIGSMVAAGEALTPPESGGADADAGATVDGDAGTQVEGSDAGPGDSGEGSGGCGCSTQHGKGSGAGWLLIAAAAWIYRRRRL